MDGTMTQEEFLKEIRTFVIASDKIGDNWTITKKDDDGCEKEYFLVCHQKVSVDKQLLHFEYHVAYNVSYQVPVLYFKVNREDGSAVNLEQIWDIFKRAQSLVDDTNENCGCPDMYKILTQMEHPQLFVPFFALHPCRAAELLASNANSKNRILTYISTVGPYVCLNLDLAYGKAFS